MAESDELLRAVYEDYWSTKASVQSIISTRKLVGISPGHLPNYLIRNGLKKEEDFECPQCHTKIYRKIRTSGERICSCQGRTWHRCQKCSQWRPDLQRFSSTDECPECERSRFNEAQKSRESHPGNPTSLELRLLQWLRWNRESLVTKSLIDADKIAVRCGVSLPRAKALLASVIEKGLVQLRMEAQQDGRNGETLSEVLLDVPRPGATQNKNVRAVLSSELSQEVYMRLRKSFHAVFVEVSAAVFVKDVDALKPSFRPDQGGWFFTKRFDFVCCDIEYKPILIVECIHAHGFANQDDDEVRNFKRDVAVAIDVEFALVNSISQLGSYLGVQEASASDSETG